MVISLSDVLMCSKQISFILSLIMLISLWLQEVTLGYNIIRGLSKQSSFIFSLISLWLQMVICGYSMVIQGYIIIRCFDVFKTGQLYFFPYIFGFK